MKKWIVGAVIVVSALAIGTLGMQAPSVAQATTPAPVEQVVAESPGGGSACREYNLGNGCGMLKGSVGCHKQSQISRYNANCRASSSWGGSCPCK